MILLFWIQGIFEIKVASGTPCVIILAFVLLFFQSFSIWLLSMTNVCMWESIYFLLRTHSVQLSPRSCIMRTINDYLLFTFSIRSMHSSAFFFFSSFFPTKLILNERIFIPLWLLSVFSVLWFTCGTGTRHISMVSWWWSLCCSLTLSK